MKGIRGRRKKFFILFTCLLLLSLLGMNKVSGAASRSLAAHSEGMAESGKMRAGLRSRPDGEEITRQGENSTGGLLGQAAKVILVGDSRTVNMSRWASPSVSTVFVAKSGRGYGWFVKEGIPAVNAVRNPGDVIIIWLGVNDYRSPNLEDNPYKVYARKINALAKNEWSDSQIYVSSVGYVDRSRNIAYYGKDKRSNVEQIGSRPKIRGIAGFNERLKKSLNEKIGWIDVNAVTDIEQADKKTEDKLWLTRRNGMKDGLHYSKKTTLRIYEYFMHSVLEK